MLLRRVALARFQRSLGPTAAVCLHTSSAASTKSIAVVGAGLAGLTLTLHLARHLPPGHGHRIVLYDADQRLGGWVRSDRMKIDGAGKDVGAEGGIAGGSTEATTALIEAGPRSIRPAGLPGLAMLELIRSLGLSAKLLCVPKSHPSAKNRFLYYAGKIHLLPSSLLAAIQTLFLDSSHPLSKAKVPITVLRGFFKKRDEKQGRWADESIESFLTRRLGSKSSRSLPLLDYVGSAVLHGIYAADASQLSVRSIFGFLWTANLVHGSPSRALMPSFFNRHFISLPLLADREGNEDAKLELVKTERQEKELGQLKQSLGDGYVKDMEGLSVVSFPDGVQTLTDAIAKECRERGVSMEVGCKAELIALSDDAVKVQTSKGVERFERVICALPSTSLAKVLHHSPLPHLAHNHSSTVAVLNIVMAPPSAIYIPPGFGYLVPRACAREGDNPMGLLGVVFDSEAVPGQDGCTKLTMMFGGPFWKPGYGVYDLLSSHRQAHREGFIDQALSLLARHLSCDEAVLKSEGTLKRLSVQQDCITTYAPGHLGRMADLDAALQEQKRLTLIGASYTGVSVNDVVLNATRTARRVVASEIDGRGASVTGLEELVRE